jgi:hypothetical protein
MLRGMVMTTTVPKPRTPADTRPKPHLVLVEELLSAGADPTDADWLLRPRPSLLRRLLGRA